MNTHRTSLHLREAVFAITVLFALTTAPSSARAEEERKSPASKIYVTDVSGEARIDNGQNIQEINKKSVYTVQGSVIETKTAAKEDDKANVFSTMVYSNGTGAYFGSDTRVEVRKFHQEAFTPNRGDMNVEPSISQTQAFVARGTVGLCTSKLVAGSSMNYETPLGNVAIRGQKLVIDSQDDVTTVSMLDGESTVSTGPGGQVLRAGEQALIRKSRTPGEAPRIQIRQIPPAETRQLEEKVAQACKAKQTVYFEVKERQLTVQRDPTNPASEPAPEAVAGGGGSGGGASSGSSSGGGTPSGGSPFDANTGAISTNTKVGGSAISGGSGGTTTEIVAVPVTPVETPVRFTVSPAILPANTKPGG